MRTWLNRDSLIHGGLSLWAGGGPALALSRLLYEINPPAFAPLGGPAVIILALLAAIGAWFGLRALRGWLARSWAGLAPFLIPLALAWAAVFMPLTTPDPLRGGLLLGAALLLCGSLIVLSRTGEVAPPWADRAAILVAAALALIAYLLTMQRTVGRHDTFEFQVTAPVLGVAHPTGYPLLLILGKLFSYLPVGSVAARINLIAVLAGVVTVAAFAWMLVRVLGINRVLAALLAITLGLAPHIGEQAVAIEVYMLNAAFGTLILACLLWLTICYDPADPTLRRRGVGVVWLAALLTGLGITNHLTTTLLIPPIALVLLLKRPRLTVKQWLIAAALGLLALPILLYIPWRWYAIHGEAMTVLEFLRYITGAEYGGLLVLGNFLQDWTRWAFMGRLLTAQYTWIGAVFAGVGLAVLAWRTPVAALATAALVAGGLFFGMNYRVPDISGFLLSMLIAEGVWVAVGMDALLKALRDLLPGGWSDTAGAAALTALAIIPLSHAWTLSPRFDWPEERAREAWGRYALSRPLPDDAVILADTDRMAPLEYLHRIEGVQPQIDITIRGSEADNIAEMERRLAQGDTVFLARFLPGLEGAYHLRSWGPLVEVGTEPLTEPPAAMTARPLDWANGETLLGYRLDADPPRAGNPAHLTLYWQAPSARLDRNNYVRLRLVDQSGQTVWHNTPAAPVGGRYPTVAWKPGEIIPDYHPLPLPLTLPPDAYDLQVALAPPYADEIAPLAGGGDWADVTPLTIQPPSREADWPGRHAAVLANGVALVRVDMPPLAPTGVPLHLVGVWRAPGTAPIFTDTALHPGESMPLPERVGAGLTLRAVQDDDRVTWVLAGDDLRCGWLRPRRATCRIATTRLKGQAAGDALANFGNRLLLKDVDFEAGAILPGQAIPVTLEWQSLRAMDTNYTVFVHLLGPDGRLHGQVDSWPVQGTYPTSQWTPGEQVSDPYTLWLDADAPSGPYRLEIGLYVLGTDERLRLLDEQGNIVDDKLLLDGLYRP